MNTGKLILALILLLLGAAAGYFYGFDIGFERGVASVDEEEQVVEPARSEDRSGGEATTTEEIE